MDDVDLLILAAGRGSRMGEATNNIPKLCLKVNENVQESG